MSESHPFKSMDLPGLSGVQLNRNSAVILVPVLLIMLAEMLLFVEMDYLSICIHVALLLGLPLAAIFFDNREITMAFQALMLLPLLRLVNISMPIFFETTLYVFVFIYAPLIIPVYLVAKEQDFTLSLRGFRDVNRMWLVYIFLAILVAILIAQGEYAILASNYLIPDLSFISLLKISLVMVFFVGFIEELIFRFILQTRLADTFGVWPGLIIASLLFGVMHSGYGAPLEVLMTAFAGLILGYMFLRTKSISFVSFTHGFVNVFLFGVIPHLGPGLGLF
ncbi:CPBP family intramembrane glutamic endopeptidase [Methanohalophilus mahii]|uniref:Abortive infection protein n=1 Tax=Methanohalophilus mahii (strain ATCC 35705 / DSM 5219 / SLP) TaxID=547558 RepID=D5E900_METMS|nr:CPBP family intramembrane glutamic endopeptidase [Methanohalophilus mahii]ADE35651.1 Abortive infection protein [Methanohalophilus mahii DSM 5219]